MGLDLFSSFSAEAKTHQHEGGFADCRWGWQPDLHAQAFMLLGHFDLATSKRRNLI